VTCEPAPKWLTQGFAPRSGIVAAERCWQQQAMDWPVRQGVATPWRRPGNGQCRADRQTLGALPVVLGRLSWRHRHAGATVLPGPQV